MNSDQPQLRIRIGADVSLVPIDYAGAAFGLHMDSVMQMVESGDLPFVFDLSTGVRHEVRELRIWSGCLTSPERAKNLNAGNCVGDVIADVIGTDNADVRGAALESRWRISNQTLRRLLIASEIHGRISKHTLWINRSSLEAFLNRRRVV